MELYMMLTFYTFFQLRSSLNEKSFPSRCVAPSTTNIEECTDKLTNYSLSQPLNDTKTTQSCTNKHHRICRHKFNVTHIRRQIYTTDILRKVSAMIEQCCGNCTALYHVSTIYKMSDINHSILETSDLIFPIIATRTMRTIYGFHYIPVLEVPSAYYITLSATKREMVYKLIMGCLRTWPLIVICLLFSMISGFVIWIMERKRNGNEFPEQFREGFAEGFWWSFISMTTVGYGDRTPKSCPGRLFAVCWVLMGITIFSILTGSLTNQITSIYSKPVKKLRGKMVGALAGRFHDATMIAQHGGSISSVHFNNTEDGIIDLFTRLENRSLDGLLLNRVTYYYFRKVIETKKHVERYKDFSERFSQLHLDIYAKDFLGEKLTVGILIKDVKSYNYFRTYFDDNWIQMQGCNLFYLNSKANVLEEEFSGRALEGYFYQFLYAVLGILGLIACFGGLLEFKRTRGLHIKVPITRNGEEEMLNGTV